MTVPASSLSLSSSTDPVLIDLVEELARRLQAGEQVDPEAFARAHPDQADALRRLLPMVHVLADLGRSAVRGDSLPVPLPSPPEQELGVLGDFRILREIGRGGMGIVYETLQISLARPVALKVLPFAATLDPKQLQRFKQEAQAAALLHHPNVVPVYAVGCERGVHYYAMQYVDGRSLASLIHELRQVRERNADAHELRTVRAFPGTTLVGRSVRASSSPATPSQRDEPAAFRMAAHFGIQAAEALQYAHEHGVIHRDVKPANLLVDEQEKLWITDFGLAQIQNAGGLTLTGDVMGTLRYMSPEQALGKRHEVDHRADIYSLGVTLYELVTLEPPFPGGDRQELLRQIAFEEPRPPSRLRAALPGELETIVLKAIAKSPDDRYATAQELADDLNRYLEDKPILAKRPSLAHKLRKWSRRHRTALSAAAVMLVLGVIVGLAATSALVWQEKRRAETALAAESQARQAEKEQRGRAEANEKLARQVVDEMYTKVAEEWLAAEPRMQLVQRDILLKALHFYELLLREHPTDPQIRFRTSQAYHFVGRLQFRLGQHNDGDTALRKQIALLRDLVAEFPDKPRYRFDLFYSLKELAIALYSTDQEQQVEELHREAHDLIEQLVKEYPGQADYKDALGHQKIHLAGLLHSQGKCEEAEQGYRAALAIAEELTRAYPDKRRPPHYSVNVASNLCCLGSVALTTGRIREAEQYFRDAIRVQTRLARMVPEEPTHRLELMHQFHTLGSILGETGQTIEAKELLERSLAMAEEQARDFPNVANYRTGVAVVRSSRGLLCLTTGDKARAEMEFRGARAAYEKLVADFPASPQMKLRLSQFLADCPLPEVRAPDRAVQLAEQAFQNSPEPYTLGLAYLRAGKWSASMAQLEKIVQGKKARTVSAWFLIAIAYWHHGEKERAHRYFTEGVEYMDKNQPLDLTLRRHRAEAAALLKVNDPAQPRDKTPQGR